MQKPIKYYNVKLLPYKTIGTIAFTYKLITFYAILVNIKDNVLDE